MHVSVLMHGADARFCLLFVQTRVYASGGISVCSLANEDINT